MLTKGTIFSFLFIISLSFYVGSCGMGNKHLRDHERCESHTYLSQQDLCGMPVSRPLIHEADAHHCSHLDVVRNIKLRGRWRQESRDVDAEKPGNWHIHGAEFSSSHTKKQSNTCHLMTLRQKREEWLKSPPKQICNFRKILPSSTFIKYFYVTGTVRGSKNT